MSDLKIIVVSCILLFCNFSFAGEYNDFQNRNFILTKKIEAMEKTIKAQDSTIESLRAQRDLLCMYMKEGTC